MKNICFVLSEGRLKASSLLGAIEVFEKANEYLVSQGKAAFYSVTIAGHDISQQLLNAQFVIQTGKNNLNRLKPDLVIIPALHEEKDYSHGSNKSIVDWLIKQYRQGCELASLCTGSFLLAATGLLANKECSTHWKAGQSFKTRFPEVRLCTDKIITDADRIYTAGGGQSALNLILYLVEKYTGRATALYCAKILQIDIERDSQSPFILFEGYKDHQDEVIYKVQQFVEKNIDERITVEFLAAKFALSKRSFIRRFKKATGNVPVEYIQKVKMEAAKRSLEQNRKNIRETMYSVGYTDEKAFRNVFKKVTGLSPTDYRKKYNRKLASNAYF